MIISSRTPEGDANQCPICGHHIRLEPSMDTRDAPCPRCGHLLWFEEPRLKDYSSARSNIDEAERDLERAIDELERANLSELEVEKLRHQVTKLLGEAID